MGSSAPEGATLTPESKQARSAVAQVGQRHLGQLRPGFIHGPASYLLHVQVNVSHQLTASGARTSPWVLPSSMASFKRRAPHLERVLLQLVHARELAHAGEDLGDDVVRGHPVLNQPGVFEDLREGCDCDRKGHGYGL